MTDPRSPALIAHGATYTPAKVTQGQPYWRLVEAHGPLFNMRPCFSADNETNVLCSCSELLRDLLVRFSLFGLLSNGANVCIGEFSKWVIFAQHQGFAILLYAVLHILGLSAKPEMGWIYTCGIIATMANVKPLWYRAKMQLPTRSWCGNFPAWIVAIWRAAKQTAVVMPRAAQPGPTFIRGALVYLLPETSFDGLNWLQFAVMPRDESDRVTGNMTDCGDILGGNGRGLSASTHAQAGWIGGLWKLVFAPIVSSDKAARLTFDSAVALVALFGNLCFLPTTAVAITVGNIVRGMILHSNVSFADLLTPPNDSSRCGGNFIGRYSFIIAQASA